MLSLLKMALLCPQRHTVLFDTVLQRSTSASGPLLSGGGPAQMSGRWLIPAAGYYGVPTGKNGVAKMASLRLRIGAQITRKYAHNLLIDLYILNFYGKQH